MITRLLKSKIGKSIAIIAGGTVFAQFLNAILSPLITRIYSPEEYGILTTYSALLLLFSLGAFKYELAIPIVKSEKRAINVLMLSLGVLFLYVMILTIAALLFGSFFLKTFNIEILYNYILLIPLGVLLTGLYKILKQWSFRVKDYKTISKTTVNQSIVSNLFKIIAGMFGIGASGLILGNIIGQSAGMRVLSKPLVNQRKSIFKKVSIKEVMFSLKRYKDFPIYNTPTYFLITIASQSPILFLTTLYGSSVVGLYGLAYTIVKLPMNLIGNSVGDVFFSEAASIGKKEPRKILNLSHKLMKKLMLIGSIPLLALLLFGPQLFSFVFGSEWYESGVYARIVAIMLFFTLIFAPISRVYEIFEKQKVRFYIDVLRVILVFLVFFISYYLSLNSYLTILIYSIVISAIYFLVFIFAQLIIKKEIKK